MPQMTKSKSKTEAARIQTRSAVTPAAINGEQGWVLRSAEVVRVVDVENRTVELAFSSEAEVERWFGIEVLDHTPGAMRADRLSDSAALLNNHNWDRQIGVVESVSMGADKINRAVVRFSRAPDAEIIFQDVIDEIRKHVSVSYKVHGLKLLEERADVDVYLVTDWEPYEISIVPVPADITVGVGRGAEISVPEIPPEESGDADADTRDLGKDTPNQRSQKVDVMNEKVLRAANGDLVRAMVDDDGKIVEVLETLEKAGEAQRSAQRTGFEGERARAKAIYEMAEKYGADDMARSAVKDGVSVDDFQSQLLDKLSERSNKPVGAASNQEVGLSDHEIGQFSFVRAFRALANPMDREAQEAAAFEYEASRAAAQKAGKNAQGIMVPTEVLTRALNTSTTGIATGDTGGFAVDRTLLSQSFIEILRNKTTVMNLGTTLGGLVGGFDIPKQTSGATGYWVDEDEDVPETGFELGQVPLDPKTVGAFTEITRRMLMQSSLGIEAIVRADLARALGLSIDLAAFYGDGNKKPLGIINQNGVNAVTFAGAVPTYAEVVQMESQIAVDNADIDSMQYILPAGLRGSLKTAEKFPGTNGMPIWEAGNTVNGYGTQVTNQITAGDMFFGNFADLIVGLWGGLDLMLDPYTNSTKGRLRIVAMQDVDVALRRPQSFCIGRDAT